MDIFTRQAETPRYARTVSFEEIEKNDFNLNLPRYLDSQIPEDIQDIEGHLRGGIPIADVDALADYWAVFPGVRRVLFTPNRPGYADLAVENSAIKNTINEHPEFETLSTAMHTHFARWRDRASAALKALGAGCHPKDVITQLSEDLLTHYATTPLIDQYDVYQHLLDYWGETMQDDLYLIAADGWTAETTRIVVTDKKGKEKDKGWRCDLIPKGLIVGRYYAKEQSVIDELGAQLEIASGRLIELEEENGGDDGAFTALETTTKANVNARLKEIKGDKDANDEARVLHGWIQLTTAELDLKRRLREAESALEARVYAKYPTLTERDIKALVVDDKWLDALEAMGNAEASRVNQELTHRLISLSGRYTTPLSELEDRVSELTGKVADHLKKMGWS